MKILFLKNNISKVAVIIGFMFFTSLTLSAQTPASTNNITNQKIIKLQKENGVFYINDVSVNGVPMRMIYDTGAAILSLSNVEANQMLKHGQLTAADFINKSNYSTASGEIIVGINVIIKEIVISGIKINNIKATIIDSESDVLMGQSVLQKLGKTTFDPVKETLTILDINENSDIQLNKQNQNVTTESVSNSIPVEPTYKAENEGWIVSVDEAYVLSKQTGKPILANFTGSDWCGWCKRLTASVFVKEEFKTWAAQNVILLELDFPNKKKVPVEIQQQNAGMAQAFGVKGYPTIRVFYLDKDEEKNQFSVRDLGQTGYKATPTEFINDVKQMLENGKP